MQGLSSICEANRGLAGELPEDMQGLSFIYEANKGLANRLSIG
jgi:phage tail protein X